jgi:hypothetical protein
LICIMAHRLISSRQKTKKKTTKVMKQVVIRLMVLYDPNLFFLNTNWSSAHIIPAKTMKTARSTVIVMLILPDIIVSEYPAISKIGLTEATIFVSGSVNWSLRVERIVLRKKITSGGIIDAINAMCAISYSEISIVQIGSRDF